MAFLSSKVKFLFLDQANDAKRPEDDQRKKSSIELRTGEVEYSIFFLYVLLVTYRCVC